MHGLINRSIQSFLRDSYGAPVWQQVVQSAGLEFDSFEPMLTYDDGLTDAVLNAAAARLARAREVVLEDLGSYLVSHANLEPLRRLLRFGGVDFLDFLQSLDELPGRSRLAVPDLVLPQMELTEEGGDVFTLVCRDGPPGFGNVMAGILRAMADDYGALALIEVAEATPGQERIAIRLLDRAFARGRHFDLATGGGAP